MPFLHPWYLALLGLVALPLIIHLINLFRHRRVEWAAMEFLLESQRRNRRRVLLKELLLMLLRMAAVAIVVLVFAQPRLRGQLVQWLGNSITHEIVILDDSLSMGEKLPRPTVFVRAKSVLEKLLADGAASGESRSLTLLRASQSGQGPEPSAKEDFLQQPITKESVPLMQNAITQLEPSYLNASLAPALARVREMLRTDGSDQKMVYVVSDFRENTWQNYADLKHELSLLGEVSSRLYLIRCADAANENVTISSLAAVPGTRAAGVPSLMEVAITNHGPQPVRNITVETAEKPQLGTWATRPEPVVFELLGSGETSIRRFPIRFDSAGIHQVRARLPGDALDADNERYAVVDVPESVSVLVIKGTTDNRDARYLTTALVPPGTAKSGLSARVEMPAFLGTEDLSKFHSIFLLNVGMLDAASLKSLEAFATAGGGVAIFMGDQCQAAWYNESFFRDGAGLFPLPLGAAYTLPERLTEAPDLLPEPHRIFKIFEGERNSFVNSVRIERAVRPLPGWSLENTPQAKVLSRLRGGDPFIVERAYGKGKAIAVLTTAGTLWSSWPTNPSYVPWLQEMQAHLASAPESAPLRQVGSPWQWNLPGNVYAPEAKFLFPQREGTGVVVARPTMASDKWQTALDTTGYPGIYELQLRLTDGTNESRFDAFNIDPSEGSLATVNAGTLAARLRGVDYTSMEASTFTPHDDQKGQSPLSSRLLVLLLGVLLAEQVLAYFASYHPGKARTAP